MAKKHNSKYIPPGNMDFFGPMWPIIGSVIGVLLLLVLLFILMIINFFFHTAIISLIISLIYSNIILLFLASIAFGFSDYLSHRAPPVGAVSALLGAIGGLFVIFFILAILKIAVPIAPNLNQIYEFINANLLLFFVLLAVAGYASYFLRIVKH